MSLELSTPESVARRIRQVPGLEIAVGEPLAGYTTLKIGGPAELLVEAATERSLARLLSIAAEERSTIQLLGLGSNVLVPDEGVAGIVVRLTGGFRTVRIHGESVTAGGAVALGQLARKTARLGLTGLEALSGFPSTVGGAVYMNAGSYGTEICDLLIRATVLDRAGRKRRVGPQELEPRYRKTILSSTGEIVVRATLQLGRGDSEASLARIEELNRKRWAALPSGLPNAGSIFRNPEGDFAGRLIEAVGLKGERRGGAQISEKHANVIVNLGEAKASEVLDLMLAAHRAVHAEFAVRLEPELILVGSLREQWQKGIASDSNH